MAWVGVDVEESGDNLIAWIRGQAAVVEGRTQWALEECAKEWRWFVVNSTWYNPRPSPAGDVIARVFKESGDWVFEYGWRAYKGRASSAQNRLELRKNIMHPVFAVIISKAFKGQR